MTKKIISEINDVLSYYVGDREIEEKRQENRKGDCDRLRMMTNP